MSELTPIALIQGYYGMQNAGDDAFLAVTAWGAKTYCGVRTVYTTARKLPSVLTSSVRSLSLFPQWHGVARLNIPLENRVRRHAAYIIWGGGSIIHSGSTLLDDCRKLDRSPGAVAFAVGVSLGPFSRRGDEEAAREFLPRLKFIGVRDQISYNRGKSLFPEANIHLTFDLAPLLLSMGGGEIPAQPLPRRGLAVALCNYERFVAGDRRQESLRLDAVAAAIRRCAGRGVLREVAFVDFNSSRDEGDHELHSVLADRLRGCVAIEHLRYAGNPLQLLCRLRGFRGVLAMRLHAAVFAFCGETPAAMICYHEKCWEWAKLVGIPNSLLLGSQDMDESEIAKTIERLMGPERVLPRMSPADAVAQSLSNWQWLTGSETAPAPDRVTLSSDSDA
jgi:polysaccharide pyruvyl transferase WcaK-like protein